MAGLMHFTPGDWRRNIGGLLELWDQEAQDKRLEEEDRANQERELLELLLQVNIQDTSENTTGEH
jgi:hypothetical protein